MLHICPLNQAKTARVHLKLIRIAQVGANIDIFGEPFHQKVALIHQVVGLVPDSKRTLNFLIQLANVVCKVVDFVDLYAYFLVDLFSQAMQPLKAQIDMFHQGLAPVANLLPRIEVAWVYRKVLPGFPKLVNELASRVPVVFRINPVNLLQVFAAHLPIRNLLLGF